ncbi:MAG TPA: tetratricopeptide repeat protein [Saprospiraceae bacterium]|nr:tetratricopeptide repeat protein [Saprospiraceae bacterium]
MSMNNNKSTKALDFFRDNQNIILGIVGGIVLIVAVYFGYKNWIVGPKDKRAVDQMYQAQFMFDKDSFQLALTNPGVGGTGFIKIADNYSGTKSGNLAKYYAGICYLNLGNYDKAIQYLESYKEGSNLLAPMKYAALGDAYSEKNNDQKALDYYSKAAKLSKDESTGPYVYKKLAMFQEKMKKYAEAEKTYTHLRETYPRSAESTPAEAHIERLKLLSGAK